MEQKKELNIDISAEVAKGSYSNLALITHSPSEFVVDFIQAVPGLPKPVVNSRIVMCPENAKRLLRALQDNIEKYEQQFGPIQMHNPAAPAGSTAFPFGQGGLA